MAANQIVGGEISPTFPCLKFHQEIQFENTKKTQAFMNRITSLHLLFLFFGESDFRNMEKLKKNQSKSTFTLSEFRRKRKKT